MHALLKGQILRQGQHHLGSDQTLHHGIVGQVDEHGNVLGNAALLKGPAEEIRHVVLDAHCAEHDGELFVGIVPQRSLLHDLGRQLVVGQAVAREDGQLLSPDQGGQAVDGRDSGADIVSGVLPGHRV